jgi:hypothetical protein
VCSAWASASPDWARTAKGVATAMKPPSVRKIVFRRDMGLLLSTDLMTKERAV